ncbi:MAG TPA: hypothetical protein VFC19_25220 [Candidatus Limnocylindrales bacterium]|nr:hypothetical protein [Candidatus Limnocylindrales bacterium]
MKTPVQKTTEAGEQPARTAKRARLHPIARLQRSAGNRAVSKLFTRSAVQRADCPPAPVAPPGTTATEDPKFGAVTGGVAADAKAAKDHPPAEGEARKAAEAAVPPSDDKEAQSKAAHTETMSTAKPAGFDKAAFIAAVTAAIEAQRPSTNEDAKNFASSGRAAAVKSTVAGQVAGGKQTSAHDIAEKTAQAPDPGVAVDKPVTPLPAPAPAPGLHGPDPAKAIPDKAPAEQTELGETGCTLESKMAEANVTDEQLAKSNEPEMTGAVAAKQEAIAHAQTAPAAMRSDEEGLLTSAKTGAAQAGKAGAAGMLSERLTQTSLAGNAQGAAKGRDEQERARISGQIKNIFEGTKKTVDGILSGLDGLVESEFNAGEKAARDAFEANHKRWMDEYEDRIGLVQWLIDKFLPTKPEVLQIFTRAAKQYEQDMKAVIARVADVIERELNRATTEIANGRAKVKAFVADQPKALQGIAGEAAAEIGSKFDSLDSAVKDKQQSLVEDLSQRYNEARQALDKRVQELQEEHKSWRDKAVDAVDGVIETIKKLKEMLMGVLARAAGAIELIIADPIGFVGNLVNAVKSGVLNFKNNILDHLQKGLKAWLFGNLAAAGVEIPQTWDLKGVLKLILSILGLTWSAIRVRILKFIPEPLLVMLEGTVEVVKILINEGPAGLWKWVVAKIGDFKEMILSEIKQMVVVEIVKAGVMWLLSLLNPASAFVKACKAIVDIIMFFVNNAAQIASLVNAVLDSVESIARGGVGKAAAAVEKALSSAIPVVLGFLASLLGLGNIPAKIKAILTKIQEPIGKVVDGIVGTIAKFGKKLLAKLKGKKKPDDPAEKEKRLKKAAAAAQSAVRRFAGKPVGGKLLKPILAVIRVRYRLTSITLVDQNGTWAAQLVINPSTLARLGVPTLKKMIEKLKKEIANVKKQIKKNQSNQADTKRKITKTEAGIKKLEAQSKTIAKDIVKAAKDPIFKPGKGYTGRTIATDDPRVSDKQRRAMQAIGKESWCHTCGKPAKRGTKYTPDHQPPSKLMTYVVEGKALFSGPQELYPHCRACSNEQGGKASAIARDYKAYQRKLKAIKRLETILQKLKASPSDEAKLNDKLKKLEKALEEANSGG